MEELALHSFRMTSQISCYSRLLGRDFSKPDGNLVIYNRELADRPSEQWNQRNIKSSNYKRCDDKPSKHLENSSKFAMFSCVCWFNETDKAYEDSIHKSITNHMRDHAICGRVNEAKASERFNTRIDLQTT